MIWKTLLILSLVAAGLTSLALPARVQEAGRPGLSAETVALLDRMLGSTQLNWAESMPDAREATRRDPRGVVEYLVEKLAVDELVPGESSESQIYNVCGNGLTLLERLTDERICGLGRDWIGFSTHDHRSTRPSIEKVQGPWLAWLAVRAEQPVDEWFWGLSYAELLRLGLLMRTKQAEWRAADLEAVRALGARAYPYLLDKLQDDEVADGEQQYCQQANALLRRLTGIDLGEIEPTRLLGLAPEEPGRKHRLVILDNRAARSWMHRRWTSALLVQ